VSFDATTLFFSSEQAFIVLSIYFFIDSVRKLLDSPSYLDYDLLPTGAQGIFDHPV
jgi:hypothetical protein